MKESHTPALDKAAVAYVRDLRKVRRAAWIGGDVDKVATVDAEIKTVLSVTRMLKKALIS